MQILSHARKDFLVIHHFASESVCAGHPDKLCDQISDAILDAAMKVDKNARVAVEALAAHEHLVLAGEVRCKGKLDYKQVAREQVKRLGYTNPDWGFSDVSPIDSYIHSQSAEIAKGVDAAGEGEGEGAGDQGMMFGFACNETRELMPLPIMLAHRLARALDDARESKLLGYLRPDGKSQVVVRYENGKPTGVEHVTIAVPHDENVGVAQVKQDIYSTIVSPILDEYGYKVPQNSVVVNGTGVWHHPGPSSDTGLTGRKIVVDTYGGYARAGGGAFSGKDPSKVDRSGAYAARFIAKNVVAKKMADKVEVKLAYYIGGKKPVMIDVDTFGTNRASEQEILDFANGLVDSSVSGIIKALDLRRPIYLGTAAYGHFGKPGFPWEEIV